MFTIWNRVCFFFGGALFDVIMKHVFGHSYWDLLSMIKDVSCKTSRHGYDRSIETQEPESLNKILSELPQRFIRKMGIKLRA